MEDKNNKFAFGKTNYKLMLIGIALIVSGFIIMSLDNAQHGQGFLGLTLSPIIIMAGFVLEFFAIFKKEKS